MVVRMEGKYKSEITKRRCKRMINAGLPVKIKFKALEGRKVSNLQGNLLDSFVSNIISMAITIIE